MADRSYRTAGARPPQLEQTDSIPVAIRLTWDIDGAMDVVTELTVPQGG